MSLVPIKNQDVVNIFFNNNNNSSSNNVLESFVPINEILLVPSNLFKFSTTTPYASFKIQTLTWGGTNNYKNYNLNSDTNAVKTGNYLSFTTNFDSKTSYFVTGPEGAGVDNVSFDKNPFASGNNSGDTEFFVWNMTDTSNNGFLQPSSSASNDRTFTNPGLTLYYNTNYYIQSTGKAVGKNETYYWIKTNQVHDDKPGYDVMGIDSSAMAFYFSPTGVPPTPPPPPPPPPNEFLGLSYWVWAGIAIGAVIIFFIIIGIIIFVIVK